MTTRRTADLFFIIRTYRTYITMTEQPAGVIAWVSVVALNSQPSNQPFQPLIFIQISSVWLLAPFNFLVINIFGKSLIVVFQQATK